MEEPTFGPRTLAERVDDALVRLDEIRQRPIVALGAAALVVTLVAIAWWLGRAPAARPVDDLIPQVSLATTVPPTQADEVGEVLVHVSGAVVRPGVVRLPASARVLDAIEAAGGATADGDLHLLNLAAPLVDGVQIRVPAVGEDPPVGEAFISGPAGSTDGTIDINRASAAELEALNGVGPSIAAAIVAHRDEHGPFPSVESLLDVGGIGPAKLEMIGEQAVVR